MIRRAAIVAVLALTTGVWATTLEHLSLTQMIQKSTLIVRGTVSETGSVRRNGIIFTTYQMNVASQLKGSTQSTLTLEVPGGNFQGLHQSITGAPHLTPGPEYAIFVWTSPSGHNQIIGLTQGLFDAKTDADGNIILSQGQAGAPMLDATGKATLSRPVRITWSSLAAQVRQLGAEK
jgi:hypothetical protein